MIPDPWPVKRTRFAMKKQSTRQEKSVEKKHYVIIVGLIIFAVAYHYFFQPETIGYDIRYSIYVFWFPTIIGLLALGIYRKQFLRNRFAANKGLVLWTFMIFFYLAQGLVLSYLSFGQIAKISWDYANYQYASQNLIQDINCDVTEFRTKRKPYSFDFEFNGKRESFNVRYQDIKSYRDKRPEDFALNIKARKGIWNYYLIERWTIKRK
jgi:hypothetical protein